MRGTGGDHVIAHRGSWAKGRASSAEDAEADGLDYDVADVYVRRPTLTRGLTLKSTSVGGV